MAQVKTACPRCGATYRVEPDQVGREATCRQCAQVFVVRETDGTGSSIAQLGSRTVVQRAPMAVPPSVEPDAPVAASESLSQPEVVMLSNGTAPSMATPPPRIEPHPTPASNPSISAAGAHQDTPRPPTNLRPVPGGGQGAKGIDSKSTPVTPPSDKPANPAAPPPAPGKSAMLGRFEILGELGEGAFGTVYKARDTYLDRPVALKIPRFGVLSSEADAQRFLREARAAGNLRHPNIVPIYDAGKIGNTYYIASGFIEGRTLADRLEAEEKLNRREAAVLIQKLALALHYAHSKGIVHRDVKPANVMLDSDGEPLVMDFGTARREEGDVLRTQEGMHMGTPAYMSPEQHAGQSHLADARSDQWALGVMFYEMLTGERPFRAPSTIQMAYAVRETEPEKPSKLNHRIPKDLETICLKCLQKDPEKRYPSCQHVAEDLDHWLRGEPITARPIWPVERFARWCRRNPVAAILSSVTVLAILLGTFTSISLAVYGLRQARKAEENASKANRYALASQQNAERAKSEASRADESAAAALHEKAKAETEKAKAENSLYRAQIMLSHQKWLDADVGGADSLLDDCPAQYRSWDWGYLKRLCHVDLFTLRGHAKGVWSVAFSPDGKRLVSGSGDSTVKLWDAQSGQELLTLRAHTGSVHSVAFSPDGKRLASGSDDQTIKLWDAQNGQELLTLRAQMGRVLSVAFSPDGKRLASGSEDETVRLWDAQSGQELLTLRAQIGGIRSVAFSPDGKRLASGSTDDTVKLYDAQNGQELRTLRGHTSLVESVVFSPDGKRLASGSWDSTVKLWDAQSDQELLTFRGHTEVVYSVAFSPDGKRLASGCWDKTVKLCDVQSGQEVLTLRGHTARVNSAVFSPDGKRLASGSDDQTIKLWDAQSGQEVLTLRGHTRVVCSVAFSPDRKRLASGSYDEAVKLWDATTGQEVLTLRGHTGFVYSVAFSPDGKRLVSGSLDNTVKLWNTESGQELLTLRGHTSAVHSVAFSPDGKRLVSGSGDSTVKLWDAESGQGVLTLRGHTSAVHSVHFSPDGKRLASGSADKTVKLWNAQSGQELLTLRGHTKAVCSVAFSADGKRLASGSWDNTVKLWDASDWRSPPQSDGK